MLLQYTYTNEFERSYDIALDTGFKNCEKAWFAIQQAKARHERKLSLINAYERHFLNLCFHRVLSYLKRRGTITNDRALLPVLLNCGNNKARYPR
ncbi:hypothetical protein CEXT_569231 [Caerostris extrusa]|uniref:Uncharacterized protein n=1 Tax=Caerostris extrusa TaxID=172846 RepID=A0AAV4WQW5_CAEEX|nr:hypothetical protein CEXT_569231 [Caerostris extrusa]